MANLADAIRRLAEEFSQGVIAAIRSASLEEILAETDASRVRPPKTDDASHLPTDFKRRPSSLMEGDAKLLGRYVREHPGCSGEDARRDLGFPRGRWHTTVRKALAAGQLRKEGNKRATRYFPPSQPYIPRT